MVKLEQFRVVRFGRSDWNILLTSLLFWGTNNSNENLPQTTFSFFYEMSLFCNSLWTESFVNWNGICMLFQQKHFILGKLNFLWVNIELEGLIKFLVFVVDTFIFKVFISLLLIQLQNYQKTPNILIPFHLKVKVVKRKLLKSENSFAALTYSIVISVLSKPNVNMFLFQLQTMVCV